MLAALLVNLPEPVVPPGPVEGGPGFLRGKVGNPLNITFDELEKKPRKIRVSIEDEILLLLMRSK